MVKRDDKINDLDRKLIKIRCEKENLLEFLEEIKEESENMKRENQRFVGIITEKDLEINSLSRAVEEKEKNYQTSKENFMAQIIETELKCS